MTKKTNYNEESVFRFPETFSLPKELSYLVLQASQMLALLDAEFARVLKLQCGDTGRLFAG